MNKSEERSRYFNPYKYLPYQRNFIMINSERTVGKTYSTQKFQLQKALDKGERFLYIVRTQKEKGQGVFADAYMKVINEQFPDFTFSFKSNKCYYDVNQDGSELVHVGTCVAISEANSTKRINYPRTKWGLFDEYILDSNRTSEYVDGWNEPNLLLKLYHTIDREEDYLTLFMMANTIKFYNPYHMHKAFSVDQTEVGKVFLSENIVFEHVEASDYLKQKKKKSKFLRMIEGTDYGDYSINGNYINDNESFIERRPGRSTLKFVFDAGDSAFGVWYNNKTGITYIDSCFDKNCPYWFTFNTYNLSENKIYVGGKSIYLIKWLGNQFKRGWVRWTNMEVKSKTIETIIKMC